MGEVSLLSFVIETAASAHNSGLLFSLLLLWLPPRPIGTSRVLSSCSPLEGASFKVDWQRQSHQMVLDRKQAERSLLELVISSDLNTN